MEEPTAKVEEPTAKVEESKEKIPELTEEQLKACVKLTNFLNDPNQTNFLLLGPAGSGKTTVIVNAFTTPGLSQLKVVFCAFTNRATQVLKNISKRIDTYTDGKIKLNADFLTIHKLLSLEIKFKEAEDEIGFTFDEKKMTYLNSINADVIVFDECSIISKELYGYILRAWEYIRFLKNKKLKFVFLGDFWQLPPIGEETSTIFEASRAGWVIAALKKVMRATSIEMKTLNDSLLTSIDLLKQRKFNDFWQSFPYGIVPKKLFKSNAEIIDAFFEMDKPNKTTMILTFSNANAAKINNAVQDFVDQKQKRDPVKERQIPYFYPGDRCCVSRPIEVRQIKHDEKKLKINAAELQKNNAESIMITTEENETCRFGNTTNEMIYNGEILEIITTEDIKIITSINTLRDTPKYFPAQLLHVKRIDDGSFHEIVHISSALINKCRPLIRRTMTKDAYLGFMSEFYSYVPILNYGYCLTIYKAQGSEWDNIICNISSIEASIVREGAEINGAVLTRLFKTTYTALTRARENIICLYLTGAQP